LNLPLHGCVRARGFSDPSARSGDVNTVPSLVSRKVSQSSHKKMAPDMSDAPQVVPQSDYPETSWKYEQSVPEYHDKSAPSYSHVPVPYTEYETKDHSRILGLRRRIFWVLLVGASVGGTLAVKNSA
jgi:hypothetical protein